MRRKLLIAVALSGLFLVASWAAAGWFYARPSGESRPFTATVVERNYSPPGMPPRVTSFTHAQRADGSEASTFLVTAPDERVVIRRRIVDVPNKRVMNVDGLTESVQSTALTGDATFQVLQKSAQCLSNNTGRSAQLLGFRVLEVTTSQGGDTAIVFWEAPDLGCYPLKTEIRTTDAKGRRWYLTREAVALQAGEPPASFFEAPPWKEMDPYQGAAEYQRRYGRPRFGDKTLGVLQAIYLRNHQQLQ